MLAAAAVGYVAIAGSGDDGSGEAARAGRTPDVVQATCSTAVRVSPRPSRESNVVFDLFTLMGARQTVRRRRDAFNGHGYKVSATLPHGVTATLSVPRGSRSQVGLVPSLGTQERVLEKGVGGADRAVRFTACPVGGERARTGWPGGWSSTVHDAPPWW